jgi:hypothetical protein
LWSIFSFAFISHPLVYNDDMSFCGMMMSLSTSLHNLLEPLITCTLWLLHSPLISLSSFCYFPDILAANHMIWNKILLYLTVSFLGVSACDCLLLNCFELKLQGARWHGPCTQLKEVSGIRPRMVQTSVGQFCGKEWSVGWGQS